MEECIYLEIADVLRDNGMYVDHVSNADLKVYIYYTDSWTSGCLLIDRYFKEFILEFREGDKHYVPIRGTLDEVLNTYLGMRNEQ